jgi:hypothetical protein
MWAKLEMLLGDLNVEVYEPDTSFAGYDGNEDEKEPP